VHPLEPLSLGLPHVRSVLSMTRTWERKNPAPGTRAVPVVETRHFVSSLEPGERTPKQWAQAVRGQWAVENKNHWRRDSQVWIEDRTTQRRPRAAQNLALLRSATLRLIVELAPAHQTLSAATRHLAQHPKRALALLTNRRNP